MKSEVKISENRLEMTRVFDAPRQRVFDAWKQAQLVEKWWGCKMTTRVESQIDFREGGAFTHLMHLEGVGEMPCSGVYQEIVEPERIVYRSEFGDGTSTVTVEFFDLGGQTKLVLTQEGFPAIPDQDVRQIVSEGFAAAFDKLAGLLAAEAA